MKASGRHVLVLLMVMMAVASLVCGVDAQVQRRTVGTSSSSPSLTPSPSSASGAPVRSASAGATPTMARGSGGGAAAAAAATPSAAVSGTRTVPRAAATPAESAVIDAGHNEKNDSNYRDGPGAGGGNNWGNDGHDGKQGPQGPRGPNGTCTDTTCDPILRQVIHIKHDGCYVIEDALTDLLIIPHDNCKVCIILPEASSNSGREIIVAKSGGYLSTVTVYVDSNAAEENQIADGGTNASYTLVHDGAYLFQSDGLQTWFLH